MKSILVSLIVVFSLLSFTNKVEVTVSKVPVKSSKILWKAYKTASFHQGEVKLKSGFFVFSGGRISGGRISGGEFVIDMTSITNTDLKGGWKNKLLTHLRSDNFFSVKDHPTSTLVFKKVKYLGARKYKITADLTIRGVTKPINFEMSQSMKKEIKATLNINRTEFGVKYNSGSFFENLGDKLIKDIFDIDITLTI